MRHGKKSRLGVIAALVLTLALALTACGATGTQSGTDATGTQSGTDATDGTQSNAHSVDGVAQSVGDAGESADGVGESGGAETASLSGSDGSDGNAFYEKDGLKLSIPAEYDELVTVEAWSGELFSVSEKASIEAAELMGGDYQGAGWLFSIARIDEEALHEALCYDMSGQEVFAKDANGQYYMYYHPTDVRLLRVPEDMTEEGVGQWGTLCEWAETVPDTLIADNPGLTPEKRGNTELDIFLYRLAYMDNVNFTVSAASYGPMDGRAPDAKPYLDRLMNGVTFEDANDDETPDGEYIVLYFPEEETRFDFFLMGDGENYIRQVWSDSYERLYKASYADGVTKSGDIMSEWYDAIVTANLGETPQ